jgi:hypothetical protein
MYQGNRLVCGKCKYFPYDIEIKNNTIIYHSNCKMIDHNKIKLFKRFFLTYGSTMGRNNICYYYEPALWNKSGQKEWTNIRDYIEWLDKEFYPQPPHIKGSKLDYEMKVYLIYNNNEYVVSLKSWLDGTAIKDNKINYIFWYKINKNKRILHNESRNSGFLKL